MAKRKKPVKFYVGISIRDNHILVRWYTEVNSFSIEMRAIDSEVVKINETKVFHHQKGFFLVSCFLGMDKKPYASLDFTDENGLYVPFPTIYKDYSFIACDVEKP